MIADRLAAIADPIYTQVGNHALFNGAGYAGWGNQYLVVAAVAFYGQIYFDFAGYSSMAIGTARLFGFRFPKNFDFPYSSLSVTEFWRRWHISLSSWLRDYLYVPLGGNRYGRLATYRNLMITMVLGGLWHGASWNFVIWGALHGLGLLTHKAWLGFKARAGLPAGLPFASVGALLLTQAWVFVAWIFFRADALTDAKLILNAVFSPAIAVLYDLQQPAVWILLLVATDHALGRLRPRPAGQPAPAARHAAYWVTAGVLAAAGLCLMPLSQKPFIYFQF
jgi:D-alanyl-lipoteichoic acid acyltransferase DltB (MBOAT superfamily)